MPAQNCVLKKYRFDIIRSRTVLIILFLLVLFVPIFLWGFLRSPSLEGNIPDFLYRNNLIPILLFVLTPILLIYNKRRLFWRTTEIEISHAQAEVTIEGEKYPLEDLEYYEFERGSLVTSGDDRPVIFLKFKKRRQIAILACRTSKRISAYDAFLIDFLETTDNYFSEDKERLLNKQLKWGLIAFMVVAQIIFFYFLFDVGKAAGKMVPALLVMYSVFLPHIFKRKSKRSLLRHRRN